MTVPQLPSGLVHTRPAGRPKAIAKHLAVAMARVHYTETLGSKRKADEKLMDALYFATDRASINKMLTKARLVARRGVTMQHSSGYMLWVEGRRADAFGTLFVHEGACAWFWKEGLKVALSCRARTVESWARWRFKIHQRQPEELWGPFIRADSAKPVAHR